MKRRPTIHDVAAKAGVSKSTVSLVLQRSPLVKAGTAKQVREAMADLGYVYNRAAANLRSSAVGLVGLVINDLRNPFFTEFATTLQMTLAAQGYATVISNSDEDADLQARLVGSMIEHGVSAFVISPAYGNGPETFDQIARAGVPALQVLRQMDDRLDQFPFASFDYPQGSRGATRHLRREGARRIAFVGGLEGRAITTERMSGYLGDAFIHKQAPLHLPGRATRAFGIEAAQIIIEEYSEVDAAIAFNDLVGLGMIAGFTKAGRQVGRDFRLIGFDDIEDCAQVWPQLSSVACDIEGFARDTATRLVDWMDKGVRPPPELRARVRVVARGSSTGGLG
ncbi:MAG: LacI family DNA-binding transcriptional regulator [Pseudomonadota bacterium]